MVEKLLTKSSGILLDVLQSKDFRAENGISSSVIATDNDLWLTHRYLPLSANVETWDGYLEMPCKLLVDRQVLFYTKKELTGILQSESPFAAPHAGEVKLGYYLRWCSGYLPSTCHR